MQIVQKLAEVAGGWYATLGGFLGAIMLALASGSGCTTKTELESTGTSLRQVEDCSFSTVPTWITDMDIVTAGVVGGAAGAVAGLLVFGVLRLHGEES